MDSPIKINFNGLTVCSFRITAVISISYLGITLRISLKRFGATHNVPIKPLNNPHLPCDIFNIKLKYKIVILKYQ